MMQPSDDRGFGRPVPMSIETGNRRHLSGGEGQLQLTGILVDGALWQGLSDWFRDTLCKSGTIDPPDLDLVQVCDKPKAVVDAIFDHYESGFQPSPA